MLFVAVTFVLMAIAFALGFVWGEAKGYDLEGFNHEQDVKALQALIYEFAEQEPLLGGIKDRELKRVK